MRSKAVVLLSSGLDSAVNLAWASKKFEAIQALTFDYGQRSARKEADRSKQLAKHYKVKHEIIQLPFLADWTATSLVNRGKKIPAISPADLNSLRKTRSSAKSVWVPNRNGIFIHVAAALAESLGARYLVVGFNREEGRTFPDNRLAFVQKTNLSLHDSTMNHVRITGATFNMDKSAIVAMGVRLGVPLGLIWSCYLGGARMCGRCESCLRLKRGVVKAAPDKLGDLSFEH